MKASELMIGDWVLVKRDKYGIIIGICPCEGSANPYTFNVMCDGLFAHVGLRKYQIEPIPLTEEILKKNGFIQHESKGWKLFKLWEWSVEIHLYEDGSVIKIEREIPGFKGVDNCHICYKGNVHELQHALRLCGLNELADNFKV